MRKPRCSSFHEKQLHEGFAFFSLKKKNNKIDHCKTNHGSEV